MTISAPVLEAGQESPVRTPKYAAPLKSAEAVSQARLLKVLADPTRFQILSLLSRYEEEVCVFEMVESFRLAQPTISHHLRLLRDAGVVDCRKKGLYAYYSVQPEKIAAAQQALACALPYKMAFFCHKTCREACLKPVWKRNESLSLLPYILSCLSTNIHRHVFPSYGLM